MCYSDNKVINVEQKYAALIMDLRNSRSYSDSDRYLIQNHMIQAINFLNKAFYKNILRAVDFSAGDEIQGLFSTAESAYLFYRLFSIYLYPIKIWAGIGVGTWNLQISNRGTTSQDGQAYHYARHAINSTDDTEGYPALLYSNTQKDVVLNTMIGGASTISENLSVNQNQLFLATEILFPVYLDSEIEWPLDLIEELLTEKSRFDHKVFQSNRDLPFDHIDLTLDKLELEKTHPKENFYKQLKQGAFFITSGKQRGIHRELANILAIKRQTVARSLDSGNIYIARNMALAALYDMKNIERLEELS